MKSALGLIETIGLAAAIEAADAAVKSANVTLLGYENTKGSGKITVKFTGNVGAVKAAVSAGVAAASRVGQVYGQRVIARPHEGIDSLIENVNRGPVAEESEVEAEVEEEVVEETAAVSKVEEAVSEPKTEEAAKPEPKQCLATTKSGNRCKRMAVAGSDFCSVHQP